MTHVVASLNSAGLDVDTAVLEFLHAFPTSTALTAVLNDIIRAGEHAPGEERVLVLDDYHLVEASEVHEAVTFLLNHLPAHLHLVMATRSDPPLPMARLRSGGQLTEVRIADPRFRPDEAQEFLNRAMELDFPSADVDALEERTDGWIAELQLAALSLLRISGRSEVAGFIRAFTVNNVR